MGVKIGFATEQRGVHETQSGFLCTLIPYSDYWPSISLKEASAKLPTCRALEELLRAARQRTGVKLKVCVRVVDVCASRGQLALVEHNNYVSSVSKHFRSIIVGYKCFKFYDTMNPTKHVDGVKLC